MNSGAGALVQELADVIVENKAYLSEIDGKIGDGDHGVNMAKGFSRAAENLKGDESFSSALQVLSNVLMMEIGGSMGPLYGMMFESISTSLDEIDKIDSKAFAEALRLGMASIQDIGSASVGDKTLLDALAPAIEELENSMTADESFAIGLQRMKVAGEKGRDSTIDMVARIGRSSRLGERSRGVLDAGATSCSLILSTLAEGMTKRLV